MFPHLISLFVKTLAVIIGNKLMDLLTEKMLCDREKKCPGAAQKIAEKVTSPESNPQN